MTAKELYLETLASIEVLQRENRGWAAALLGNPLSASTLALRVEHFTEIHRTLETVIEQVQEVEFSEDALVEFHWHPLTRKRKAPRQFRLKEIVTALRILSPAFEPACEILLSIDFPTITEVAGKTISGD